MALNAGDLLRPRSVYRTSSNRVSIAEILVPVVNFSPSSECWTEQGSEPELSPNPRFSHIGRWHGRLNEAYGSTFLSGGWPSSASHCSPRAPGLATARRREPRQWLPVKKVSQPSAGTGEPIQASNGSRRRTVSVRANLGHISRPRFGRRQVGQPRWLHQLPRDSGSTEGLTHWIGSGVPVLIVRTRRSAVGSQQELVRPPLRCPIPAMFF